MDDFGTGYSNLSYLQQLPVSVLKIDQAFVRDMVTSVKDRLLIKTIIAMGHDLGYRVVAEGVRPTREPDGRKHRSGGASGAPALERQR